LEERIQVTNENLKALDKKLGEIQKKRKKSQAELESYRLREREIADKIEEDAKELEKMASKQTVLQVNYLFLLFLTILEGFKIPP
jgi:structural maintenance of chromosome 3 (chondroitin sulfate proteoglycan 6)